MPNSNYLLNQVITCTVSYVNSLGIIITEDVKIPYNSNIKNTVKNILMVSGREVDYILKIVRHGGFEKMNSEENE